MILRLTAPSVRSTKSKRSRGPCFGIRVEGRRPDINSTSDNEDTDVTVEGGNAPECANNSSSDNEDPDATVENANAPECEFLLIIDLAASESTDVEYWGDSE